MSGEDERLSALRVSGLFTSWDDRALRGLLARFDEIRVRAGEILAVEGELCHQLIVVIAGRVEKCASGSTTTLGHGGSTGWSLMCARGINSASVTAVTDARLLVMGHAQFRAAEQPPPARRFHFWALPNRTHLPAT